MGLQGLETICGQLIAHGRNPDTPAALVEQGTTRNQRTVTGTLATLPARLASLQVHAPTLLIIGEVVGLRSRLEWFGEADNPGSWPPSAGAEEHPVGWKAD
jgi:uroporphyrin-III C-methyltransferase/precorrin-2 dehydrogenase/sirohydrochlorin ferrochelatase